MRVIKTEFYFNASDIRPGPGTGRARVAHWRNPGVSVAWFKAERPIQTAGDPPSNIFHEHVLITNNDLIAFLNFAIQDAHGRKAVPAFQRHRFDLRNRDVAAFILHQQVIVEQSPPEAHRFDSLSAGAAKVLVGTLIGKTVAAAAGYPLLMAITIPMGILIVGSAVGVSRGLENGLAKMVEDWLNGA